MSARVLVLLLLLSSSLLLADLRGFEAMAQNTAPHAILDCRRAPLQTTPGGTPTVPVAGVPSGMTLSMLTTELVHPTATLGVEPQQTLRAIIVSPGHTSHPRQAQAPRLFYVASGSIDIKIGGQWSTVAAGTAAVVDTNEKYAFKNPGLEVAILLRVALEPSGSDTLIGGQGDTAEIEGKPINLEEGFVSQFLASSSTGELPIGDVRLFIACLFWTDPGAGPVMIAARRSIGMLILEGTLRLGSEDQLSEGRCAILSPGFSYELNAGDASPSILLFGVTLAGQPLWDNSALASSINSQVRLSFKCGQTDSP
jgi:quercetin dioxygenase-like cupin family protein